MLGIGKVHTNLIQQIAIQRPGPCIIGGSLALLINGDLIIDRPPNDIDIIVNKSHYINQKRFIADLHWEYIMTTLGDYYYDGNLKNSKFNNKIKGHCTILRHSFQKQGIKMCVFEHSLSTDNTYNLYNIGYDGGFLMIKVLKSELIIKHKKKYLDTFFGKGNEWDVNKLPDNLKKHYYDINAYNIKHGKYPQFDEVPF